MMKVVRMFLVDEGVQHIQYGSHIIEDLFKPKITAFTSVMFLVRTFIVASPLGNIQRMHALAFSNM